MTLGSAVVVSVVAASVASGFSQGLPAPTSGLDLTSLDPSVRPQDDLFRYVNGGWLDRAAIPPDRVSHGAFTELVDKSEADMRAILEEAAARPARRSGTLEQQVGDLYLSVMNEARVEALGIAPIAPQLHQIDAVRTTSELATEIGYVSSIAAAGPFSGLLAADTLHPGALVVHVSQGGTLLPDRDYYLESDPRSIEVRAKYEQYLSRIFTITGRTDPAADAAAVLALEAALARAQWTQVDSRDPARTSSRFTLPQLRDEMPGFDWRAWALPQGIERARTVVLLQPSFFKAFAALVPTTPLGTWKAWLCARYITATAPYVTKALVDARFDFFGRVLTGQELPRPRWKVGVSLVSGHLGDAIGRLYVERHFPPPARARVQQLTATLIDAFRAAVGDADWMTAGTRSEALDKLAKLSIRIGYPERWRDYSDLEIRPDDLFGNVRRALKFDSAYRLSLVTGDRREWLMSAQTVNAYYSPANNEMVLPAAILQPPLFTLDADAAVNYGGIGAVIGHEISHGFDARGRLYDGGGAVRDWWKPEDEAAYRRPAAALVAQFNAYSPMAGMHVNGELTLGENLGDLGGLSIAYRAYRMSLHGRPAPVIDGFTGDQRFFMGWAQVWRSKMREEFLRTWLMSTPYAPPRYRANGIASNLPGFYGAFGVKPGDDLFRAPGDRVKVW